MTDSAPTTDDINTAVPKLADRFSVTETRVIEAAKTTPQVHSCMGMIVTTPEGIDSLKAALTS